MDRVEGPHGRHYETPLGTFPSVTTILKATADDRGLTWWRGKPRFDEPEPEDEIPEPVSRVMDFARARTAQRALKDPEKIRREATERGNKLHEAIERRLDGEVWRPTAEWKAEHPWRASVEPFVRRIEEVHGIETPVLNSIGYAGTVDLVARVDGRVTIVDWKTAAKRKAESFLGDYRLQGVAYLAAWNEMVRHGLIDAPFATHCAIVVAYEKRVADDFWVLPESLPALGREWAQRVAKFQTL